FSIGCFLSSTYLSGAVSFFYGRTGSFYCAFFNCRSGNPSPFSPLALPSLSFNHWRTAFYHWRHDGCPEQSTEPFSDRRVAPLDDPMLGASTAIAFVEEISGLSTYRCQRVFGWIS